MDGICYVVGAGSVSGAACSPREGDFVIAADGGLKALGSFGVAPDLVVGDFDSLGEVPAGYDTVRHPTEKDDTDMMLAVGEGLKRGYRVFLLLGGVGGRLDHTVANLQTLSFIAERGAEGYLCGDGVVISAVNNGEMSIPAGRSGLISVFCAGGEARGVYLSGLKYELEDAVLTYTAPIGVSNEFTGSSARIKVRDGTLTVMWYENGFDPLNSGIKITHGG